ncbi:MAG: fibronectin type III domain-containing protein [Ignavibacteriales bacterium]|nr:fibronectin type III domain-containing protein [Ignavibacteriales bacterium]
MKQLQFLTLSLLLFLISCKEKTTEPKPQPIPTTPVVTIISPQNNSSVAGSVTIEVKATDDKGIIRVEIYIDNTLDSDRVFTNTPYKYVWDVESLPDSSRHTIYARAFDTDGHVSSSSLVNTTAYNFRPTDLSVTSASDTAITLTWQDNCRFETGFEIEKSSNETTYTKVKDVGTNVTMARIENAYSIDTIYYFRVRAKTANTVSQYSNLVSEHLRLSVSNLTITAMNDTTVQLQWRDSSTFETGFEIEKSNDGINFYFAKIVGANSTSASVNGIYSIDTTYRFRVRAKSTYNLSGYSNIISRKLSFLPPTSLSIVSISDTTVRLQWSENSLFETGFEIEKSNNGTTFYLAKEVSANSTSATVNGIYSIDTTYSFRVRAKSTHNVSSYSNTVSKRLTFSPPTNLTITSMNELSVQLNWQDNSTVETGFEIEKSIDGANFQVVNVVNANSTSTTVSGMYSIDTIYSFRVRAKSIHNVSSYSNIISNQITFPAPSNLMMVSIGVTSVRLRWEDNSTFETSFEIERAIENGSFVLLTTVPFNDTTHIVNDLDTSFLYRFRIRAKSTYNLSNYSNTLKIEFRTGFPMETLTGHSSIVYSVRFKPDGNYLASGSVDNTIKLWNVYTGTVYRTLNGHSGSVNAIAYSPDGNFLVSGSEDNTLKIWNTTTGSFLRTLIGHTAPVRSLAYSPNGNYIASGSYQEIKIWNATTGSLERTLTGHNAWVHSIAYSPNGNYIASGSYQEIKIWNATGGGLLRIINGNNSYVNSIAYSPDGNYIASGSYQEIKVWNTTTGGLDRTLIGHSGYVNSVSYSSDGNYIISGGHDNTIKIWETMTGNIDRTLTGHNGSVYSVSLSSDGNYISSGSGDTTIKIWGFNWSIVP